MGAGVIYDKRERAGERFEHRSRECSWDGCSWGAILGLVGGLAAIVVGSALTAAAWFLKADSYAGTAGTILLFAAIPLLLAGAQGLDVEEARKKRARAARCDEDE
ncbi:MAG: hypothetical protein JOZ96_18135 [Acidobacteria bacterium]|nr:hypothetical protein [Acidobacteriota bacterium]